MRRISSPINRKIASNSLQDTKCDRTHTNDNMAETNEIEYFWGKKQLKFTWQNSTKINLGIKIKLIFIFKNIISLKL